MTPQQFIAKWKRAQLTERSACHQHFLDLCDLLGQEKPADADPDGAWYTFERGVRKMDGGHGWADVWKRAHFAWEYKGKKKDLQAAYRQLQLYRDNLESPPLLVVCDLDRFEIHTNFTGTAPRLFAFGLDGLQDPANLDVLRKVFESPQALKPGETTEEITEKAAERFGAIADSMRDRGVPAPDAAHFLMKLMFCMFAEDIRLLPRGLFSRVIEGAKQHPEKLTGRLESLFEAMAEGGDFGADEIQWFNGGLFGSGEPVFELTRDDIEELIRANEYNWSYVEPSVFGTLFERLLDPSKRSQIGAHYTSREDIETLLEPVMMAPLRREWDAVKQQCEALLPKIREAARKSRHETTQLGPRRTRKLGGRRGAKESKARQQFDKLLSGFTERLAHVTVLDPACGSGNFLYVALHLLLDLEKQVISYAATHGVTQFPHVRPTQLAGMEINPYAHELAQIVIWIGYLQWMHHNSFPIPSDPVLEPIESIHRTDAILDLSDPEHPIEPEWPTAEFIVGNPPFLGGRKTMRRSLDVERYPYVDSLFATYRGRVQSSSDLCCYWFEKARAMIESGRARRAGLLGTQGIRKGANQQVLKRIDASGGIFFAISDRNWINEGAAVHVSLVGFDSGEEKIKSVDGISTARVNPDLTAGTDATEAKPLESNKRIGFQGITPMGPFEIPADQAIAWMKQSGNPNGRPNSDVIRRWADRDARTEPDRAVDRRLWTADE